MRCVTLNPVCSLMIQPHSFSSREFLRALLVGKEVAVNVTHSLDGSSQKKSSGPVSGILHRRSQLTYE